MTEESGLRILTARQGYDLAADHYESWRWYRFWRQNETPLVETWLEAKGGAVLDIGCGNSPYLDLLLKSAEGALLVDLSEKMLRLAARKITSKNASRVSVAVGDIRALPIAPRSVRQAICTRVLSNVDDCARGLREIARALEPGGKLLVTDIHPDHGYQYTRIETPNGPVLIETYKRQIAEVIQLASSAGLSLQSIEDFSLFQLRLPPPRSQFLKLYLRPDIPIFYSLTFRAS